MKRAAAYLRVSTAPQLERFGPTVQRSVIDAYAQRAGLQIVEWYQDAITGKSAERDALTRLLDHAPRYEAVVLSSVDRLARRVPVAYGVLAELVDTGMDVHSADMGLIDLDDDSSNVQFGIRTLMADSDHRKITRRLYEARIAKVAHQQQPIVPLFGYGWRQGEPVEREQHWGRWMYARAAEVGTPTIAAELNARGIPTRNGNPWTPARVREFILNPVNKGEYQYGRKSGRIRAVTQVPALVDVTTWNRAVEATTRRTRHRGRRGSRTHLFPLMGRFTCAECGSTMLGRHENARRNRYYMCNHRSAGNTRVCSNRRYWPAEQIHDALRAYLHAAVDTPDVLRAMVHVPVAPAPDLRALAADLDRRVARLDAAYDAGAFDAQEYALKRQALKNERDALLQAPAVTPPAPPDLEHVTTRLRKALQQENLADTVMDAHLRAQIAPDGTLTVQIDTP